jgi:SAM-dependent methyltransferase
MGMELRHGGNVVRELQHQREHMPQEPWLHILSHLKAAGYQFITPTPATHRRVNARKGNEKARSLTDIFGWSRPFSTDILAPDIVRLLVEADALDDCGAGVHRARMRVSTLGGDYFIHESFPTDRSDAVFFGPDTYRFVSALDALVPKLGAVGRVVDIGCGSGAGAIAIGRHCPDAEIVMADINPRALQVARINAEFAGVAASAVQSDLLNSVEGSFDLILSNPPYLIDALRRDYRHGGGESGEGLSLNILDAACDRLNGGGTLALYTGSAIFDGADAFKEEAHRRLAGRGLAHDYREIDPDVFGEELEAGCYTRADRIAAVLLTATQAPATQENCHARQNPVRAFETA